MKLKTMLALSFGIILAFVALIGTISHIEVKRISKYNDNFYIHPFQVNKATRDIQNSILSIESEMKSIALDDSLRKEELQEKIHNIDRYENNAFKSFDIAYKNYLGPRANIDSAYNAFKAWKPLRDEVIWLRQNRSVAEPYLKFKIDNIAFREKMFKLIQVMVDFSSVKADEFYLKAQEVSKVILLQIWLIAGLIFLLSAIIVYLIIKGIITPLNALTRFTNLYSQGNFNLRSNYESTNELGILAASFNRMALSIEEKLTIKEEISRISSLLLSENEIKPFCRNLLTELSTVTESQIGAIYFLNEDKSQFELFDYIGLSADWIKTFSSIITEGDFGAALSQKEIILNTQINENAPFQIVTGDFSPKEIFTIPLFESDEVLAVISLVSLHNFSSFSVQLVHEIWFRLSANLHRILSYKKINDYSAKIVQQYRTLENQSSELERHSNELLKKNIELEIAKEHAESADRLKSVFLSTMSHELRTPLNSIIGFSGILMQEIPGPLNEEQKKQLGMVQLSGRHLLSLINAILDLSKIEAQELTANFESFNIQNIIEDVLKIVWPSANSKGLSLSIIKTPQIGEILSDRQRVQQVLLNLVDNAIKFTEKGSVSIGCYRDNGSLKIEVSDTGIGIKEENLNIIFNPFIQIDNQLTRKSEGSGLGLSISEKLMKLLHGTISVKSEYGIGSTFTITLPLYNGNR